MPNPVFNAIGNNMQMPGPFGNFQTMLQQFNNFRRTFSGDPKQTVMQMVNSGKISQSQLNQAQQMAQQFQQMMNGLR